MLEDDGDFDYDDELDDAGSPALFLLLALGGFGLGTLLTSLTWTSASVLTEFVGEWGWILAPVPILLFGLASIWQYELAWLRRLGAATMGFALSQFVMLAIGFATLEI